MKLAITISGTALEAPFDARFGRAEAFCIIDTDTGERSVLKNPSVSSGHGAGVQAAQLVAKLGVGAAISGAFGPKAFETLKAAQIEMYTAPARRGATGSDVLAMFERGELARATDAANGQHAHGAG